MAIKIPQTLARKRFSLEMECPAEVHVYIASSQFHSQILPNVEVLKPLIILRVLVAFG